MKKFLSIILFILAFAFSAQAATVTISATQVNNWRASGAVCSMRVYASDTFTASDGLRYIGGAAGSQNFFQSVQGSVAGNVCSIPSFTIPSTTDSIDKPQVRYTAAIFDARGTQRAVYLANFYLTPTPAVTAWADIINLNKTSVPAQRESYYTAAQTEARLAQISTAPIASDVLSGKSRLTAAPASAPDPVAVGANDAVYLAAKDSKYLREYASLSAAVAAIGATDAELIVSTSSTVSASLTVPANVRLKFSGAGALSVAASQTLTISDCSRLTAPLKQIFGGSGSVVCTNKPARVFPEWFGAVSGAAVSSGQQTINTTAVNAAITASGHISDDAGASEIFFQPSQTYLFNGSINLNLRAYLSLASSSAVYSARLVYTGTGAGTFVSITRSSYITFQNLKIEHSGAFTGTLVKSNTGASDPQHINFLDVAFQGTATNHASTLVNLDQAIFVVFQRCKFSYASVGVEGRTTTYSNVVQIRDSSFFYVYTAAIKNAGESWTIDGNNHEVWTTASKFYAHTSGTAARNLAITNNWIGDVGTNGVVYSVEINALGAVVSNNYFALKGALLNVTGSTAIRVISGQGINITANRIESTTGIAVVSCFGLNVIGNDAISADTPTTGTGAATNYVALGNYGIGNYFSSAIAPAGGIDFSAVNGSTITRIKFGSATLAAGAASVIYTNTTAAAKILVTGQASTVAGNVRVTARVVGGGFTLTSTNAGDTGTVDWILIEP